MKRSAVAIVMLMALLPLAFSQERDRNNEELVEFEMVLSGAQEVPAVQTEGEGEFTLTFNEDLSRADYSLDVSGTQTAVTGAHLHCAPAGENGPVVAPLSTKGDDGNTINNDQIGIQDEQQEACGVTINNIASLLDAISDNRIYVNVHTEANPDGELRAQIFPQFGE